MCLGGGFQNAKIKNEFTDCKFYYGQISFFLFELIGICKPFNWNSNLKIFFYNSYTTFIIIIYILFLISILIYILQNFHNIDNEMETFYYFLALFTVLFKMIIILIKRKTVIETQKLFMNKLCQPRDNFELDILQRTSISCR